MQSRCKKLRDKIIGTFVAELRQSSFFQLDFKSSLNRCLRGLGSRKVEGIVCYGLGSFCDGVDISSRYQLALLLLVHEYLTGLGQPLKHVIDMYDPSFSTLDRETLLAFNGPKFMLLEDNEYCGRRIITSKGDRCVLVYMPHLDKYLYNNLLGANWTVENLGRLVVLGNSFQEMIDNETPTKQRAELYFMHQLVHNFQTNQSKFKAKRRRDKRTSPSSEVASSTSGLLREFEIDDSSFSHSNIFNSLAFHILDSEWLLKNGDTIREHHLPAWTCVTDCANEDWVD